MNNRFDDVLTQMAHDETSEFRIFIRLKMLYAWQVAMHSRLEACLIIFINKMLLCFFFVVVHIKDVRVFSSKRAANLVALQP